MPSIVYGLWGLLVLAPPAIRPFAQWLNDSLGWFPLFADGSGSIIGGGTIFTAGIVLAVMILPTIAAVSREVFVQTPPVAQVEAALALGATRWEVVRTTVIPFGKSGYISGSMLGLGRALGETMALYMILRTTSQAFSWSLFDGGATIASKIALATPSSTTTSRPAPTSPRVWSCSYSLSWSTPRPAWWSPERRTDPCRRPFSTRPSRRRLSGAWARAGV